MGTQKSSSTRWSLKSQWAICSSRYPKPEEETVSSPIEKTSPSPQKTHTCIEDCSFPSGRSGKCIRCCVSSRHYHVKCLNLLEDEIEGHAWPCLECRVLPYNVKYIRDSNYRLTHFMSSMMNDKITEIKDLKLKCQNFQPENETLRQRNTDLQYEMTALKPKLTDLSLTSRTPKDCLVLGSSLVRNIDPNKLTNTNVCCMPRAKITHICGKLMNLSTAGERFSHISLVVGGNDCADLDIDMAQTVVTYRDAVTTAKEIADNVTISATRLVLVPQMLFKTLSPSKANFRHCLLKWVFPWHRPMTISSFRVVT